MGHVPVTIAIPAGVTLVSGIWFLVHAACTRKTSALCTRISQPIILALGVTLLLLAPEAAKFLQHVGWNSSELLAVTGGMAAVGVGAAGFSGFYIPEEAQKH